MEKTGGKQSNRLFLMSMRHFRKTWVRFLLLSGVSLCLVLFAPTLHKRLVGIKDCQTLPSALSSATNISRRPPTHCSCKGALLKDFFKNDNDTVRRRQEEYRKHKARTSSSLDLLLVAPANSPLQYPIQGFTVVPLQRTLIPGLGVYAPHRDIYKVSLVASRGLLSVEEPGTDGLVEGDGGNQLNITALSASGLNALLGRVHYTSTVYRLRTGDLVHFLFEKHNVTFPVDIWQPSVPIIFDLGEDINSQVTITTKTFLRYFELNTMISSIRQYYKTMKIIIADDSFDPIKVNGSDIEQYFMPPGQGWFAGRTLAVSQVTTKYFLWVDDDFYFTEKTQIEKLVEVMESMPELDMVSAGVGRSGFSYRMTYEEGQEDEGGCLLRFRGPYKETVPGFPQCSLSNVVINFFLARTDSVRKVLFDPRLKRAAHSQFFVDAVGKLLIASCNHITVDHQSKRPGNEQYHSFRKQSENHQNYLLYFFKNHFSCINLKAD
ncbi:beta-1,4 N-acetylgalactosaminyltransferase 1-like [Clupea harengus]|uniref:Beta-1,4 N-acetylgalactosaminyltransferase 1-like n=1 Tax=Clupea harengus TaxID=7950 RepID=A0A6P8EY35_CLUHA|nr:beta-1,4 N-acetylgalactosaminyltransferase 1-like [Clupea harengus]